MTIQEILPFLQAMSSLAIAGGFIYSALQFRQWRRAQHVANFTRLVELQMHLREMRVNDPALAKIYLHDMQGMTTDQDVRYYFFNLMQLSVYEIVWYGHRAGQIPDDYYRSWERRIRDIVREETFRKMLASPAMKILHDDFQTYIMNLAKEVGAKS